METEQTSRRRIAVLTDGNAGNEAQARALAEALARQMPLRLEICQMDLIGWAAALPPALLHRTGLTRLGLGSGTLPEEPQLVIGAGRKAAPIVAMLGRNPGTQAVQLMNPVMPVSAFDAVIAPAHDQLNADNVLSSLGSLSRITSATISTAQRDWRDRIHPARKTMAVLIGGPTKSATFGDEEEDALLRSLSGIAETHRLLVTTSRRTSDALKQALKLTLGAPHFIWTGQGDNPYPAILGFADTILVTADSVNMASEAACTGKPVYIFPLRGMNGKLRRFHSALEEHGASRKFTGVLETWSYHRLAEADRAASWLLDQLGWRPR
ncbi:MAG: mitochondrial fission ELM1 family protein [Pseudomonadota bacterium]